MRIEKLTENKIRFILNMDDLKEKNIDFHSFMSNSIESQDLFLDMLKQAETEIGFKTENYKLMIEAIATADGNFILTVTRISDENSRKKNTKKDIKTKRRNVIPSKLLSIYRFSSFDDFCDFCTYISDVLPLSYSKIKNSSLYLYNSSYYLILNNMRLTISDFKVFCNAITEFGTFIDTPQLFERKIKEYGKPIISKQAITTGLKYFKWFSFTYLDYALIYLYGSDFFE